MGLLSGLKHFGVDMGDDIYKENKARAEAEAAASRAAKLKAEEEAKKAEEKRKKQNEEPNYLLARSYTCPVCGRKFKSLAVKANRARRIGFDIDLRPIYDTVDALKYTIISCPDCGYSATERNFSTISANQINVVREKISMNFKPDPSMEEKTVYTYDDALGRYQMALATSVATVLKASEKAYLCLRMSWLCRGQRQSLLDTDLNYIDKYDECKTAERELQRKALDGFLYARQNETFPICGNMDENTVDYIIAALHYKVREFDEAMKFLPRIMVSASASKGIKEQAATLKEKIQNIKASNAVPEEDDLE